VAALARKGQQILVAAIPAAHPGKAIFQNAAIQVAVNDLLDVGSQETILPWKPLVINLFEGFKIVFHALIVWRVLGDSLAVYGFRHAVLHLLHLGIKPSASAKDVPILIISENALYTDTSLCRPSK
jgi:hypothetical protein